MKRILFFGNYAVRGGQRGRPARSTYARVIDIAKALSSQGFNSRVAYFHLLNLGENARAIGWAEAVVFHRIQTAFWLGLAEPTSLALYEFAVRKGKRVLFDFDDALFLQYPGVFELMAARSSANLAAAHFLLAYAKRFNKNTRLVQTPVDTELWKPSGAKGKDGVTLGWHGTATMQFQYLRQLRPVLRRLASKYDLTFRLLGTLGSRTIQNYFVNVSDLRCEFGPSAWLPYTSIPTLMEGVDIGLCPLVDTRWSRGKCQIKVLEYMAMGIPTVASPVGENRYLVKPGVSGFLAQTEDEWVQALGLLIEDGKTRDQIGENARRIAVEDHSIPVTASKIKEVIMSGPIIQSLVRAG